MDADQQLEAAVKLANHWFDEADKTPEPMTYVMAAFYLAAFVLRHNQQTQESFLAVASDAWDTMGSKVEVLSIN
jgi:hypothetical protein